MTGKPRYVTKPTDSPIWVSEPFRVFFPFGIAAAIFGLLIWPLHYFGWWPVYPAIQHPRILVFGFGAAFVFGFLGMAWPRFLEAEALKMWELVILGALWLVGQLAYAKVAIAGGDLFMGGACLWLLFILGRRLFAEGRDLPPPGFAIAFLSVGLATFVLLSWGLGWNSQSPDREHLFRLIGYQGFLLLPLMGVGSYLFPRFFQKPGERPPSVTGRRRAACVWLSAALVLVSFFVEVFLSVRWGNVVRISAVILWGTGAVPVLFNGKAGGTRPWALRFGIAFILIGFACRAIWPREVFAFEHILFLGGFSQIMLLVADRVTLGHCEGPGAIRPKSLRWRWIVWLMVLTAMTRATADLVPSTRISHHIYAAVMLIVIFLIWWTDHGRRMMRVPREEKPAESSRSG
jgi:uncharacterized protein involved in response to NO